VVCVRSSPPPPTFHIGWFRPNLVSCDLLSPRHKKAPLYTRLILVYVLIANPLAYFLIPATHSLWVEVHLLSSLMAKSLLAYPYPCCPSDETYSRDFMLKKIQVMTEACVRHLSHCNSIRYWTWSFSCIAALACRIYSLKETCCAWLNSLTASSGSFTISKIRFKYAFSTILVLKARCKGIQQ